MNLIARAERGVLTRAIVSFALIVAIVILAGVVSAKAAPSTDLRFCDRDASYRVSCDATPAKAGKIARVAKAKVSKVVAATVDAATNAADATYAATDAAVQLGGSLVDRARHYIGTNPTGWNRVWCGRFMAMIAPDAAARVRNPNAARNWARDLPHVSPQVGAIAVFSRGSGGHVGVVSGFDANGNPITISGNFNGRVNEGLYPSRMGRVIAYVSPNG